LFQKEVNDCPVGVSNGDSQQGVRQCCARLRLDSTPLCSNMGDSSASGLFSC